MNCVQQSKKQFYTLKLQKKEKNTQNITNTANNKITLGFLQKATYGSQ